VFFFSARVVFFLLSLILKSLSLLFSINWISSSLSSLENLPSLRHVEEASVTDTLEKNLSSKPDFSTFQIDNKQVSKIDALDC
jgi:hypothetical protein